MTVSYRDYITVELNFDGNLFIFQLLKYVITMIILYILT